MYFIIKELLNNVIKHSAETLRLAYRSKEELLIHVWDNGTGLTLMIQLKASAKPNICPNKQYERSNSGTVQLNSNIIDTY
jgi:anti-sigma regulatory factor (Ser/Thr protein kinase)